MTTIKRKQSGLKLFFKWLPPSIYVITSILLTASMIIVAILSEICLYIVISLFVILPIIGGVGWILYEFLDSAVEFIKLINRIKYLPLTQSEFDTITRDMTLTECLLWFEKQVTFKGSIYEDKFKYDDYFRVYIDYAANKYKHIENLFIDDCPKLLTDWYFRQTGNKNFKFLRDKYCLEEKEND